jgi:hypothetical protein
MEGQLISYGKRPSRTADFLRRIQPALHSSRQAAKGHHASKSGLLYFILFWPVLAADGLGDPGGGGCGRFCADGCPGEQF